MEKKKMLRRLGSAVMAMGLLLFLGKIGASSIITTLPASQMESIDKMFAGEMVNKAPNPAVEGADVKGSVADKTTDPGKVNPGAGGANTGTQNSKAHLATNVIIAAAKAISGLSESDGVVSYVGTEKINSFQQLAEEVKAKINAIPEDATMEVAGQEVNLKEQVAKLMDSDIKSIDEDMAAHYSRTKENIYIVAGQKGNSFLKQHEELEQNYVQDKLTQEGKVTDERMKEIITEGHLYALQNTRDGLNASIDAMNFNGQTVAAERTVYAKDLNSILGESSIESFAVVTKLAQAVNPTIVSMIESVNLAGGQPVELISTGDKTNDAALEQLLSKVEKSKYKVVEKGSESKTTSSLRVIDLTKNVNTSTILDGLALVSIASVIRAEGLNARDVAFRNFLQNAGVVDEDKKEALERLQEGMKAIDPKNFDPNKKLANDIMAFLATTTGA